MTQKSRKASDDIHVFIATPRAEGKDGALYKEIYTSRYTLGLYDVEENGRRRKGYKIMRRLGIRRRREE